MKRHSLTRRSFVIMAVALPLTPLKALATQTSYVCTPCGLWCDSLEFDKPGSCTNCGMPLIQKPMGATTALNGGRLQAGLRSAQFPFELLANAIYLPVEVNGKGPFPFAVDTGSFNSIIAAEFVRELGIQTRGSGTATGAGSDSSPMAMIDNLDFRLPPGVVMSTRMGASVSMAGLWPLIGHAFYGDIGHDVLQHFVVQIDFDSKVITLYDPRTYHYTGSGAIFPADLWGQYDPQIPGELLVPGQPPIAVKLTIDTGAGGTILTTPLVNSYHIPQSIGKTIVMPDHGIGNGASRPLLGRLTGIRIGSYLIDGPLVGLSQDTVGSFVSRSLSVNLGGNILKRFTLILDYPNNRVILEPNKQLNEPFHADASGLVLRAQGVDFRTFVVQEIVPESPAAEAGILQGDVVTALDGNPVNHYALWQLQDALKASGRTYALTVLRNRMSVTRKLTLRALL